MEFIEFLYIYWSVLRLPDHNLALLDIRHRSRTSSIPPVPLDPSPIIIRLVQFVELSIGFIYWSGIRHPDHIVPLVLSGLGNLLLAYSSRLTYLLLLLVAIIIRVEL